LVAASVQFDRRGVFEGQPRVQQAFSVGLPSSRVSMPLPDHVGARAAAHPRRWSHVVSIPGTTTEHIDNLVR
jgi:hypothetical protein